MAANVPAAVTISFSLPFDAARPIHRGRCSAIAVLALLTGCGSNAEPVEGPFERTGELVAMSGGDAGAAGACISCHGLKGEGNGAEAPRLAGLNAGYIVRQMDYFSTGLRRHPNMVWISDHVDWPQRVLLGEYYAALPVPDNVPGAQPIDEEGCDPAIASLYHEGDPARGLPSCASCHGDDGAGIGQGNPPLAGQPTPYLENQLKQWRSGERYGDPQGEMLAVSRLLAEGELRPLAGYSSALRDASAYPVLPEACPRTRRPDPRNGA